MAQQDFDAPAAIQLQVQLATDFAGALTSALAYIGDRLGLFALLADGQPRTTGSIAREAGLQERYVREWASVLAASGYLQYLAEANAFRMTQEQAAVLVDRESPHYAGGTYLYAQACVRQIDALMDAFRKGGGISFAGFGPEISEAIEKLYANTYRDGVAVWIEAIPELAERLQLGGRVADVGCGGGHAAMAVAARFRGAACNGFDLDEPSLERARATAVQRGLPVSFELLAAEDLPLRTYDLVMAFNCIHDMAQPSDALRGIRSALVDDGWFLWSEAPVSDRLEENTGLFGRIAYGASCMHCMTVSLANGGAGLGVVVGPETIRSLANDAGFRSCDVLPVEHPQHRIYVLRP